MEPLYLRLAETPFRVTPLHDYLRTFCEGYLCPPLPDAIDISATPDDIAFERELSARADELLGVPTRVFRDAYLETLAVYRRAAELLPAHGAFLFHGSAIAVDGAAYLFTAKSGTGKSTHARLWREQFGGRAVMINDDKPLIRLTDGGPVVYGTPWNGKHRLGMNASAPLRAVCILTRSASNHIEPITARDAWPMLLQQAYRPRDTARLLDTMRLLDTLTKTAGLYRLGCNMEPEAAQVSYAGMNGPDAKNGVSGETI